MSLARLRSRSKPSAPIERSELDNQSAEIQIFTLQARWLLEWHNKRASAFEARATALLGFVGVMFVLLPLGISKPSTGLTLTPCMHLALAISGGFLIVTALCCAMTLRSHTTATPSIEQLREQWHCYAKGHDRGTTAANVAESLLHGLKSGSISPVQAAKDEADQRGRWFTAARWSMVAALAALGALTTLVLLKS